MILAAPLVIPFAKAVGLSVGTLGMAALSDKVNDYIEANPEESTMILKTLVPSLGIGEILMKKEKISLEDLDEMTDEEAQDLSKEEKAELMKQAGKRRNRELSIATSEKIGLSGPGKEKQDIEYEVDERYDEGGVEGAPRPQFDYKKFFRKRRADGGAIRKNFSNGGDSIYDQNEYVLAAIKLASDKNIGIGDAMMITSDEDFDIDSMEYKGSNKGILEILNQKADGGSIGIEVLFTEKKPRKNFNVGGSASIQDYADAVSKVSAGTTAQKLQNIGSYATNKLGLTQKHFDTIAAMKSDPKKFGIDKQIDYAKLSGKDLVKGANPALQPFVALGQGLASPIYDYYQALQKYSDKGYQGDFELSKKGIVDFGKNLLRVGEEFAAQKPIQMAAGRTLGGLEAIQEGLSQFGTAAAAADASKLKPLSDKERFRSGIYAANQVDPKTNVYDNAIDKMYANYTKNFAASGGKGYFSSPDMLSRFKQFYADGGRVGLFMGGPALTGTALDIYNSMKAYGFTDQDIANSLRARGLYDTTPAPTATAQPLQPNITRPNGGDKDENDNPGVQNAVSIFGGLNVEDPEAEAYGIDPTVGGTFARMRSGLGNMFTTFRNIPTPLNIALKTIENIRDPYKGAFGGLNKQTRDAIARESVRDLQGRIDRGDFGSTTPTPQDRGRGGGGRGGSQGGRSAGFDQGERGGSRGR